MTLDPSAANGIMPPRGELRHRKETWGPPDVDGNDKQMLNDFRNSGVYARSLWLTLKQGLRGGESPDLTRGCQNELTVSRKHMFRAETRQGQTTDTAAPTEAVVP